MPRHTVDKHYILNWVEGAILPKSERPKCGTDAAPQSVHKEARMPEGERPERIRKMRHRSFTGSQGRQPPTGMRGGSPHYFPLPLGEGGRGMVDRKALQFLSHTLMYGKNLKKNTEILILILAFFTVIFYTFLKLNDMHK